MVNDKLLRLAGTLVLIGGVLVTIVAVFLHPGGGSTYEEALTGWAASGDWFAIHLAQFVGMAGILSGLLVLFFALNLTAGFPHWVGFFAVISAGLALALDGVTFAVDGVANKFAANAWMSAPAAEKAVRFASALAVRWVEIGTSSYLDFTLGLALVLLAVVIVWTARVPRPIGYLLGLSGLFYFEQGWLIGTTGFSPATTVPTNAGYTLLFISVIWLLIVAWPRKQSIQVAPT